MGEYLGGKWYGGLYGWTWPHGYYNIGYAAVDAALNAFLISGERRFLDLPRRQFDAVWEQGRDLPYAELEMSLPEFFATQPPDEIEFVVPYRYGDHGWFDFQPMSTRVPAALWNVTEEAEDWNRLLAIRARSTADWRQGGRRPRARVAGLPVRRQPGLSGGDPGAGVRAGQPPARPDPPR